MLDDKVGNVQNTHNFFENDGYVILIEVRLPEILNPTLTILRQWNKKCIDRER